jgi:arylesterase / paraoxonase
MKFSRPRRPGRALIVLAVIAIVSAGGRALYANGVFSSVDTGFAGTCKVVGNLPGVQDIETANGMAFLAISSARGAGLQDGIYAMPLAGGAPVKLAGGPKDFHPRGIGLYRSPDGQGLFLFAVNKHSAGRFSIDSFEVTNPGTAPVLVAQGTIEGGLLINPQDVAALSPNSFYVANGTASKNPLIHFFQTYGVISGGNVLFFNGTMFRQVADGLYGTRGLVLTPDNSHVIVGNLLARSLTSFTREPVSGVLTEDNTVTLPAGPEKLSMDNQGQLWVAGHANLGDWRAMMADAGKRATSQIFRVSLLNGEPQKPEQVYGNDGHEIAGASAAVSAGSTLLIGSSLDKRLLSCSQ